jgi:hypothetical protein
MADRFIHHCPKCKGMSADPITCTSCGIIFEKYKAHQMRPESAGRLDSRSIQLHALALPICFALVWGMSGVPLLRVMLFAFCQIPFHELGHGIAAWLCGRWAFPVGAIIPFVAYTFGGQERSWLFFCVFQSGLFWLSIKLGRMGLGNLRWVPWGVGLLAIGMTWMMPVEKGNMLVSYGGIGGEFVLSTLLICLFYYRLPDRLRWDFFRFPALMLGVACFASSLMQWRAIQAGRAPLPRGTMMVGNTDSNGDIDRLLSEFGWTEVELIRHFNQLAWIGLAVIALHYAWGLANSRQKLPISPRGPADLN